MEQNWRAEVICHEIELATAIAEFERPFDVYPVDGLSRCAVNGEPFVTLCSGGIKQEGALFPCICSSPHYAVELWALAAREYANRRGDTLQWRERPTLSEILESDDGFDKIKYKWYIVYSRLLIYGKNPHAALPGS